MFEFIENILKMTDHMNMKVCVIDNGTGFTKMGWAGNTEP